jgi:PleD family two-component response regulator
MKILIVDDSVSVRKALERLLSPRQYSVLSASSAEHAMELIADEVPNLIIADVVMPNMNGFELTARLKSLDRFRNVPILLISGIVDAAVTAQAKEAGAEGVVSKPFTPEDLFPRIDAALAKSGQFEEAPTQEVRFHHSTRPVPRETRSRNSPDCCHHRRCQYPC